MLLSLMSSVSINRAHMNADKVLTKHETHAIIFFFLMADKQYQLYSIVSVISRLLNISPIICIGEPTESALIAYEMIKCVFDEYT